MSKHIFRGLAALFLVVLVTMLLAVPVSAAEVRGMDEVNVESWEVIDDDLYVAGTTIDIDGTVDGDLWAAGGTLNINGHVTGDVTAAVGTLNIEGVVGGAVRVVGSTINVNGYIGGDLLVGGGTLSIDTNVAIGGDLLFAVGEAYIDGIVNGYVRGAADVVTISNGVGGEVRLGVDELTLTSGAILQGDLTYTSQSEAYIQGGAQILGETNHRQPGMKWPLWDSPIPSVIGHLLAFLMIMLIGIIIVLLASKRMALMADTIGQKPWRSLGWGAIVLFGTPIAVIIVCFTVVGIPLALIGLVLYGIALYLAQIPVALWLGRLIIGAFNRLDSKAKRSSRLNSKAMMTGALALGLVIICLLRLIPYVGWFVNLAVILFGLGGALVSLRKR
jgi:cytoskeletal protein CcmA (bactofilin family)